MDLKFRQPLSRAAPSDCPTQLGHFGDFEHKPGLAWSGTDVRALRFGLLVDAIKALENPRVGADTRSDLLDWIESDEMTPFSFRVCCLAEGLNPDNLRDLLNFRFKKGRQAA
jgi:hypothetical protein